MQQFLSCGHVPIDALLIVPTFEQVANDTKSLLASVEANPSLLPMECPLLSQKALSHAMSPINVPPPEIHFSVKAKNVKSFTQRSELLQKSKDLQQQSESIMNSRSNRSAALMNMHQAPMRNKTMPSRPKYGMPKNSSNPMQQQQHKNVTMSENNLHAQNKTREMANKRGAKLIEITDQPLAASGRLKKQKSVVMVVNPAQDANSEANKVASSENNRTIDETLTSGKNMKQDSDGMGDPSDLIEEQELRNVKSEPSQNGTADETGPESNVVEQYEQKPSGAQGSSEAVPEYMLGLQTTQSPFPRANSSGLFPHNYGHNYHNVFPVLGQSPMGSAGHSQPNTPSPVSSVGVTQPQHRVTGHPTQSDYNASYDLDFKTNRRPGMQHSNAQYSSSPLTYADSASSGNSSASNAPKSTMIKGSNYEASPSTMFNFFQPAPSTESTPEELRPGGQHLDDSRTSSPVRSIANQLKQIADQNSHTSINQPHQTSALAMPTAQRPQTSNLGMSYVAGSTNQVRNSKPGRSQTQNMVRPNQMVSNTSNNSSSSNSAAQQSPSTAAGGGRAILDKLLSSATKLTDSDRAKIQRFLAGETPSAEATPGSQPQSKVSVVISEMRVPSEIKGELCTSVISTVFEMDYENRKWKVVKHTNVMKGLASKLQTK
ncbi:uncharacterized protein LOC142334610 isoform X2 [Convolutriloba macropyga]